MGKDQKDKTGIKEVGRRYLHVAEEYSRLYGMIGYMDMIRSGELGLPPHFKNHVSKNIRQLRRDVKDVVPEESLADPIPLGDLDADGISHEYDFGEKSVFKRIPLGIGANGRPNYGRILFRQEEWIENPDFLLLVVNAIVKPVPSEQRSLFQVFEVKPLSPIVE